MEKISYIARTLKETIKKIQKTMFTIRLLDLPCQEVKSYIIHSKKKFNKYTSRKDQVQL